ncbi:anti-sigma factor [Sphingomonas oleivorans]|uniref:Anti-sigma factor n=1 Tax=Sphingomonas oleivorans TaxID=1735121 RepID=A0A2T5G080_9SPHN|nr:anti-sigma factor [Sphingomonas oleivorans]PTQ12360.1 anti-sigma factor [Sphingomonas oleivorans]
MIDDQTLLAWIDGELDDFTAARVAAAVKADPTLAAKAEAHRALGRRLAEGFRPLLDEPVALPPRRPAAIVSLAAAREARQRKQPPAGTRPWMRYASLAATLVLGVAIGSQLTTNGEVRTRDGVMVADGLLARALDEKLSGQDGRIRVALSFRDKAGDYCRSFDAERLSGVACRTGGAWQMRATTMRAAPAQTGEYRMASAGDPAILSTVERLIAGDPLDAATERAARDRKWAR